MDALEAVIRARDLLSDVTPLKTDCGRICGGACCQPDEDGQGGMLLFPGEEGLYDPCRRDGAWKKTTACAKARGC